MIGEEIKQYLIKVCRILNSHNVDYLVVPLRAVPQCFNIKMPMAANQGGSVYAGMAKKFREKIFISGSLSSRIVAQFRPEPLAHFAPERVAHFRPE